MILITFSLTVRCTVMPLALTFFYGATAPTEDMWLLVGQGLLTIEASRLHTHTYTHHSVGVL
jgi:hypothetical protein